MTKLWSLPNRRTTCGDTPVGPATGRTRMFEDLVRYRFGCVGCVWLDTHFWFTPRVTMVLCTAAVLAFPVPVDDTAEYPLHYVSSRERCFSLLRGVGNYFCALSTE